MKFSDLFPNPIKQATALFDKREGQPWLQGVARNFGHAAFGNKVGDYVDQHFLGDPAPGQLSPTAGMAAQIQPQAALQPLPVQPQAQGKQGTGFSALLQQLMQAQQKGGM